MMWKSANFKGKTVWVAVTATGELATEGGRVPMRYSKSSGAKIYRAGASGLKVQDGAAIELSDGVSADAKGKGKSRKGSGFGSAGTRTAAQSAMAAAAARKMIADLPDGTAIAFTDGACKGNPGPAGAGAWVQLPDGRVAEASQSLGLATNNVGELSAIGLALDIFDEAGLPSDAPAALFTDSKYTHGAVFMNNKAKANRELIGEIKPRVKARTGLTIYWIAGHVGVDGNERADALANAGVSGVSKIRWLE